MEVATEVTTAADGALQAPPVEAAPPQAAADSNSGEPPSFRRIRQLLEQIFGHSLERQITGLLKLRKAAATNAPLPAELEAPDTQKRILHLCGAIWGAPERVIESLSAIQHGKTPAEQASNTDIRAAYLRGRADLEAEIQFSERLAAARQNFPGFDAAWRSVKPLIPRSVWQEIVDEPHGLAGAYHLSKLPALCQELSELEPDKARERFRHFLNDLKILGAI
jgi:hypothetical protein